MDSTVKRASPPRDPKTGRSLKKLHLVDLDSKPPEAAQYLGQADASLTLDRLELEQRQLESMWKVEASQGRGTAKVSGLTYGMSESLLLKVAIHMLDRRGMEFYPFELRRIEHEGLKPGKIYHVRPTQHKEMELMRAAAEMQIQAQAEAMEVAVTQRRRRICSLRLAILLICALVLALLVTAVQAFSADRTPMNRCQQILVLHDVIRTVTGQAHLKESSIEAIDDMMTLENQISLETETMKDQLTLMTCELILNRTERTRKAQK